MKNLSRAATVLSASGFGAPLIPLAAELRAMGCSHRIGFFLHVPMPPPLLMAAIP